MNLLVLLWKVVLSPSVGGGVPEWILWRSFFSSGKRRVAEVGIFFRSRRQIWVRIVALQVMIIYNWIDEYFGFVVEGDAVWGGGVDILEESFSSGKNRFCCRKDLGRG